MTAPTLVTERLVLRPGEVDDHPSLSAIRGDERVGRFTGGVRDGQRVWFTLLQSAGLWSLLGYGYWVVTERRGGALVGEVGFADFRRGLTPDISGAPEAGWIIAPESWGRGYASEAVGAAHNWLDTVRPGRSTCIISPDNPSSIKIAEKNGYTRFAETTIDEDPIIVFERHSTA